MYTQSPNGIVIRDDGAQIPADPENADYRAYLDWIDAGNTPTVPAPVLVLPAVTQRQARLALREAGRLADVEAAIAAMPGAAGDRARIEWEWAASIDRASPLVAALGAVLQMDAAALDALFESAGKL